MRSPNGPSNRNGHPGMTRMVVAGQNALAMPRSRRRRADAQCQFRLSEIRITSAPVSRRVITS